MFFKSPDKKRLLAWYREHLGVDAQDWGGAVFQQQQGATTTWSVFAADSDYFGGEQAPLMINYRVDDLDAMLQQLRGAGVEVIDKVEDSDYGRFGWAVDIDGNRFELWQPPAGM